MGAICSTQSFVGSSKNNEIIERASKSKVLNLDLKHKKLPTKEKELKSLRLVSLSNTKLIEFPICVMNSASTLKICRLIHCGLSQVPNLLKEFKVLEELDLSGNEIRLAEDQGYLDVFPSSIQRLILVNSLVNSSLHGGANLRNLVLLNLSNNRSLVDIGNLEFGSMTSLEELDLDGNGLSLLPIGISHCPRLAVLSVQSNKLTKVPEEILRESKVLHTIHMEGNEGIESSSVMDMPGMDAYLERRKLRLDKQIAGGTFQPQLTII